MSQLFINGKIFTSNPDNPTATCMLVENGKIAWIGEQAHCPQTDAETIDLQGKRILPGLIDAHLHPLYLASAAKQIACTEPFVRSIDELVQAVLQQRQLQKEGEWIEGWGYDEGKLVDKRSPNRYDLDCVVSDAPVILTRTCAHIITVNSYALKLAGITKNTPNPPGGQIDKDENGEPTGVLRESARELVQNCMPVASIEENAHKLAELSPFLFERGITAITDLMARTEPVDYVEMYELAEKHGLLQRTVLYYMWDDLKEQSMLSSSNTDRTKNVHIGGIKLFADGSVSGRTAWVNPPFLGDDENYGMSTVSSEALLAAAEEAKKQGVQIVVHAMGEQAIDQIVNTFKDVEPWLDEAASVRIEHAAMPSKEALEIAAHKGIAFVPQPIFLFAEIESYHTNLGVERTKTTYPVRTFLEAGIPVALSSDAPATAWADPVNPFVGIQAAVTRIAYNGADTGQDERISVEEAIELYTRGAQEITRIPQVGQLRVGYFADFIVLDQDILQIPADQIKDVKVEATYFNGKLVYNRTN